MKKLIKSFETRDPVNKYVVNTDSNVHRRILAYHEDAGLRAKTFCTWEYLRGACRLSAEPPTDHEQTSERCLTGAESISHNA